MQTTTSITRRSSFLRSAIFAVTAGVLLIVGVPVAAAEPTAEQAELLDLINAERVALALSSVDGADTDNAAAQCAADFFASEGAIENEPPDCPDAAFVAIGRAEGRTGTVVKAFMESEPQRSVLTKHDVNGMSIGVSCDPEGFVYLVVHVEAAAGSQDDGVGTSTPVSTDEDGTDCPDTTTSTTASTTTASTTTTKPDDKAETITTTPTETEPDGSTTTEPEPATSSSSPQPPADTGTPPDGTPPPDTTPVGQAPIHGAPSPAPPAPKPPPVLTPGDTSSGWGVNEDPVAPPVESEQREVPSLPAEAELVDPDELMPVQYAPPADSTGKWLTIGSTGIFAAGVLIFLARNRLASRLIGKPIEVTETTTNESDDGATSQ